MVRRLSAVLLVAQLISCSSDETSEGGAGGAPGGWPVPNRYSWNGSWTPSAGDFPLDGLFDDVYFDGHADGSGKDTPVLPPGEWDWGGSANLSNWKNFAANVGTFQLSTDEQGRAYGWRLLGVPANAVQYTGPASYFEGSSGADLVLLGADGDIASITGGLGEGPDVLVANTSHSLDFRTGSSSSGSARDDDLLVLGCETRTDGTFGIVTSSFHTGPGNDWVFVRDIDRAAIDLGNGDGGRTDVVDPDDGNDWVVLRGNTHDFRVFGGGGNDVFVWHVNDNVQTTAWLGPNFFGGGGIDGGLWVGTGVDRLVMVIPTDTQLVTQTPTPDGGLLVQATPGDFIDDAPTAGDPYAHYCGECGVGPGGEKTLRLEYNSSDGKVRTGYFGATDIEELQIGLGDGAIVYRLDAKTGAATADASLTPVDAPDAPQCAAVQGLLSP